ncbi:MAG: hypothetical protein KGR47_03005 [Acidobacteria bacterium]|nr:hypothetical protein [Acidobacteriota bacterium]
MRSRTAVLVAVTSVLTVASPALAGPVRAAVHDAATDWKYVHRQVFGASLRDFLATRSAAPDRWFDWSTDGCSAPLLGGSGANYDFTEACVRHDFAYRNLRMLERRYGTGRTFWNAANRALVDQRFLTDMRAHCRRRSILLRLGCYGWAQVYFSAVRVLGGP